MTEPEESSGGRAAGETAGHTPRHAAGPDEGPAGRAARAPADAGAAAPRGPRDVAAGQPTGFAADLRDAVTPRTVMLVVGVLLLQFGFIASYLGAFHDPAPHRAPLAVVAPPGAPAGTASAAAARLNQIHGHPVSARVVAERDGAPRLIRRRDVDAVLLLGPAGTDQLLVASAAGAAASSALQTVAEQADAAQHRRVTTIDLIPAGRGDARGLSAFYLVVGWVVGGYLAASILGIARGARPASRRRAGIRLASLALYAIASGLGGALLAGGIVPALSGHLLPMWAFGSLLVFAVGAFTVALQALLGIAGIGIAILIFVVLGNPSAGGAYPGVLLPRFWWAIGPWLPPGAGTDGVRTIVYFPAASLAAPAGVLAGYAVLGTVVGWAASGIRHGRLAAGAGQP